MIYLLLKDQRLSYLNPGKVYFQLASCNQGEESFAKLQLNRAGYAIYKRLTEPLPGYDVMEWHCISRVKAERKG